MEWPARCSAQLACPLSVQIPPTFRRIEVPYRPPSRCPGRRTIHLCTNYFSNIYARTHFRVGIGRQSSGPEAQIKDCARDGRQ